MFTHMLLICFGVAVAVSVFFLVDFIFGTINPQTVAPFTQLFPVAPESPYGYQPPIKSKQGVKRWSDGRVIYNVTYNFEEYLRRRVPQKNAGIQRLALFFGGSNTFGEGLQDHESIPAQFADKMSNYKVYNYAYKGYGPQHMLLKTIHGFSKGELLSHPGIAFYMVFNYHVKRAIGTSRTLSWAKGVFPYFELQENGELINLGHFSTAKPFFTFFSMHFTNSHLFRYFKVDFPQLNKHHYKTTCAIFNRSQNLLKKYNINLFLFTNGDRLVAEELNKCLNSDNLVKVIPVEGDKIRDHHIKGDGHLSASGANWIGRWLASQVLND